MNCVCNSCGASMFAFETNKKHKDGTVTFSLCCSHGKVCLDSFKDPPQYLQELLLLDTPQAKKFRKNIRSYNNLLSMASRNISGQLTNFASSRGPPVFKISGSMYHLTPNVLPDEGVDPKYAQIYIFDREQQVQQRMKYNKNREVTEQILRRLQEMLNEINFYVQQFSLDLLKIYALK